MPRTKAAQKQCVKSADAANMAFMHLKAPAPVPDTKQPKEKLPPAKAATRANKSKPVSAMPCSSADAVGPQPGSTKTTDTAKSRTMPSRVKEISRTTPKQPFDSKKSLSKAAAAQPVRGGQTKQATKPAQARSKTSPNPGSVMDKTGSSSTAILASMKQQELHKDVGVQDTLDAVNMDDDEISNEDFSQDEDEEYNPQVDLEGDESCLNQDSDTEGVDVNAPVYDDQPLDEKDEETDEKTVSELDKCKEELEQLRQEIETLRKFNYGLQHKVMVENKDITFTSVEGYPDREWLLEASVKSQKSDYLFVKQLMMYIFPRGVGDATPTGKGSHNPSGRGKTEGAEGAQQAESRDQIDPQKMAYMADRLRERRLLCLDSQFVAASIGQSINGIVTRVISNNPKMRSGM